MRRAFVFGSNGSPAVGRLRYAQHGATQVNATLTGPSCGFVVSSPPPGADIVTVHTCLVAASQECEAGDTFVCYFSGHGHFESELHLCWDDTDPQKLPTTALPAKTLVDDLDRCKATNRLLLLDCCRAAAALKGHDFRFPSILPTDAEGLPSSNFVILAASAALDNVPEFDDLEGTLFTAALCAALGKDRLDADRDADGNISVSDIKHWIDEQTLKHNRRRPEQTAPYPYLFGGQQGQDLYLSFATLPPATLYQRVDVVGRWSRWEARQRDKFSYEQLHGRPETVEPPLSDLFRTSFLVGPSWHNAVATTLQRAAGAAASIQDAGMASLVSGLRSVDCSRNYEDIRTRLREVVEPALGVVARLIRRLTRAERPRQGSRRRSDDEEIEAALVLRRALGELRQEIVSPAYGRCLLIAGGLGAGRTHFVRSLLKTGEQAAASTVNNACLILPLRFSRHFESLDVTLRDAIRQATGIAWSSLEELDAFLGPGASGPSAASARTAEQPRPIPLFLVIDDLGRWTEAMPTFLESLTQFIALHTRCHAVKSVANTKGRRALPRSGVAPSSGAQRDITLRLRRWPPQEPDATAKSIPIWASPEARILSGAVPSPTYCTSVNPSTSRRASTTY